MKAKPKDAGDKKASEVAADATNVAADAAGVAADATVVAADAAGLAAAVAPPVAPPAPAPVVNGAAIILAAEKIADAKEASEDKHLAAAVVSEDKKAAALVIDNRESRELHRLVIAGVLMAMPATIGAVASLIVAWRTGNIAISQEDTHRNVKAARHEMNGMKHELVEEVRKSSRAEGVKEGKELKEGLKKTNEEVRDLRQAVLLKGVGQ